VNGEDVRLGRGTRPELLGASITEEPVPRDQVAGELHADLSQRVADAKIVLQKIIVVEERRSHTFSERGTEA